MPGEVFRKVKAIHTGEGMSQTRKHSAVEAVSNVVIGYGVAILAQIVIFPLFGLYVPLNDNLLMGAFFTLVSLIRSYVLRRLFNRWHHG